MQVTTSCSYKIKPAAGGLVKYPPNEGGNYLSFKCFEKQRPGSAASGRCEMPVKRGTVGRDRAGLGLHRTASQPRVILDERTKGDHQNTRLGLYRQNITQ
jgi:hypothetical protein